MLTLNRITLLALTAVSFFMLSYILPQKSIYDIKFMDLNGTKVDMSSYSGKKIIIFTFSGNEPDSTVEDMVKFYKNFKDSAIFIGVLSMEDGYQKGKDVAVKKMIRNKKLDIIFTEGDYSKKASGDKQSELMRWLTHKDENLHFDDETRGAGQKFFIDEEGVLYAVLGPETPYTHFFIKKIMGKPHRKREDKKNKN